MRLLVACVPRTYARDMITWAPMETERLGFHGHKLFANMTSIDDSDNHHLTPIIFLGDPKAHMGQCFITYASC